MNMLINLHVLYKHWAGSKSLLCEEWCVGAMLLILSGVYPFSREKYISITPFNPKDSKMFSKTKRAVCPLAEITHPSQQSTTFEALYSNSLAMQSAQELDRQGAETALSLTTHNREKKRGRTRFTWAGHRQDKKSTAFSPLVFILLESPLFWDSHLSLCFSPH